MLFTLSAHSQGSPLRTVILLHDFHGVLILIFVFFSLIFCHFSNKSPLDPFSIFCLSIYPLNIFQGLNILLNSKNSLLNLINKVNVNKVFSCWPLLPPTYLVSIINPSYNMVAEPQWVPTVMQKR